MQAVDKTSGRVYTPKSIVENILDVAGYCERNILKKHVIDNSCGDGAFLVEIARRYCNAFLSESQDVYELATRLSEYIHGIDINECECKKCIDNLNRTVKSFGVENVHWDIVCADAMTVDRFNGKIDFVLGNPPYIRVHNLSDSIKEIKKFSFSQCGMTDSYIVFFELGLRMLNQSGVLAYITPSSYFNSVAAHYMRAHFIKNHLLSTVVDLKHFQAFNATTYSAITVLKNGNTKPYVDYCLFDEKQRYYHVDNLERDDFYINGLFYFAEREKLARLKKILAFEPLTKHFSVKNGFATLADRFFIGDFDFDEYTIPVIKASTGKTYKCIFPYENGKLIPFSKLAQNPIIENYFLQNKQMLSKRSLEKNGAWYGFGRSQGINDVYKEKYSVNPLIKTSSDLKLTKCKGGVGVFGGLYILTEIPNDRLCELLMCDDFIAYVAMLSKYKNGGYYTFSSKDLQQYLEYAYYNSSFYQGEKNEQLSIFSCT